MNTRLVFLARVIPMATLLLLIIQGCNQELSFNDIDQVPYLSIQEAKDQYDETLTQLFETKSEDYSRQFFRHLEEHIEWEDAQYSSNDMIHSLDVPVHSEHERFVIVKGRDGHYLAHCHQSLLFVNSRNGDRSATLYRYMIPFASDSSRKLNDKPHVGFYNGIFNMGDYTGFSGFEVFTTLSGNVVQVRRLYEGRVYDNVLLGSSKRAAEKMSRIFNFYFRGGIISQNHIISTKSSDDNVCPSCFDVMELTEFGYACFSCGYFDWDPTIDLYDTLDPSICVGGGGNGGAGGGGGFDWPELPPSGDTGAGGGSGTGTGGNSSDSDETDGALDFFQFTSNDERYTDLVRQNLEMIIDSCPFQALMNSISANVEYINFVYTRGLQPSFELGYVSGRSFQNIKFNPQDANYSNAVGLFEELFHMLQFMSNPNYSTRVNGINMEVEAKLADYKFASYMGWPEEIFSSTGYGRIRDLLNTSEENYNENYASLADYILIDLGYNRLPNLGYDRTYYDMIVYEPVFAGCDSVSLSNN